MIIKLQDADITTAQEDLDYEGVIHVPDAIWNHIITESEHPDQEWVNSLYLDVSQLSIGGSGLPIFIYSIKLGVKAGVYETINTWDMNTIPVDQSSYIISIPPKSVVFVVKEYSDRHECSLITNNLSDQSKNYTVVNLTGILGKRYYIKSTTTSFSSYDLSYVELNDSNGITVLKISESDIGDSKDVDTTFYKNYIDFLWINN